MSVALCASAGWTVRAAAAESGSVTLSVNVAPPVRSITITTTGTSYSACTRDNVSTGTTLSAPNGVCRTSAGQLQIVLGEVASVVQVSTSPMTATGGTPWQPVGVTAPGTDQFKVEIMHPFGSFGGLALGTTPVCDTSSFAFSATNACVTVAANSVSNPAAFLRLTGPSLVSSVATSAWSHTVTWQAVPPAAQP